MKYLAAMKSKEGWVYTHDKICLKVNIKIGAGAFVLSCKGKNTLADYLAGGLS